MTETHPAISWPEAPAGDDVAATAAAVAAFRRDGAVHLPQALDGETVATIEQAIAAIVADPGPTASFADGPRRGFFQDADNWRRIALLERVVRSSPAAAIAGALLGARKVNFLHDHVLVKEPGTDKATPWHQDQPYSPVDGRDFLTMWIPIDPVPLERSLRFVAGSHRPGRWYRPRHFASGTLREDDDPRWALLPDVEAEPQAHPVISWAVQPGDIVAFHGLTLHAAAGNLSANERRRVLSLRWTGDEARFVRRSGRMSPPPPADDPPAEGGPLDCPAFPVVWRRDAGR